ncbi:MAG: Na/Pi cotransporter family protein [Clostridia bacterium]|nr:Na/Pi cotransporter family protein [Clostridia bacterium]
MDVFDIITLLGGLAMFLYGMEIMSDGLKKSTGSALKTVLGKLTHNVFLGFLTGAVVTAVIQSSTATIVLTVGLISAGILNLKQATGIVMGANVGTTVTAQLIRLMDIDSGGNIVLKIFKPETLAPVALVIGIILVMFTKSSKFKNSGEIFAGFGVLFIGLLNMTGAVEGLENSQLFVDMITKVTEIPVLSILVGLVITVIIQSSSATVGILQALSSTGTLTFSLVYPMIMGINIGTCVTTAMVCSIGSNKDAKRTGIIHIVFNVIGTVLFMAVMAILRACGAFPELWNSVSDSGAIANFQTIFNLATALVLLPFAGLLVKLSMKLVKDDPAKDFVKPFRVLDEKLFISPDIAIAEAEKAIAEMGRTAASNLTLSFDMFSKYSSEDGEKIRAREDRIDEFTDTCDNFLVRLSRHAKSGAQTRAINRLMQTNTNFERIGDYATDILEFAESMKRDGTSFSAGAKKELELMCSAVQEIVELTVSAVETGDLSTAEKVEPLEETIDDMIALLKDRHIERLKLGTCLVSTGLIFVETLTHLERAADQCSSIALLLLARENAEIMSNHHQYLRELHKGAKREYTEELNRRHQQYMDPLMEITSGT